MMSEDRKNIRGASGVGRMAVNALGKQIQQMPRVSFAVSKHAHQRATATQPAGATEGSLHGASMSSLLRRTAPRNSVRRTSAVWESPREVLHEDGIVESEKGSELKTDSFPSGSEVWEDETTKLCKLEDYEALEFEESSDGESYEYGEEESRGKKETRSRIRGRSVEAQRRSVAERRLSPQYSDAVDAETEKIIQYDNWKRELDAAMSDSFPTDIRRVRPAVSGFEEQQLRRSVWHPRGQWMPRPSDVKLGYQAAFDIGQRGCTIEKIDSCWGLPWLTPNQLRFVKMDGANWTDFLTFYTRPDVTISLGGSTAKKGSLRISALRDGEWNYGEKSVTIYRGHETTFKPSVGIFKMGLNFITGEDSESFCLWGFSSTFFDAMIVCIREWETQQAVRKLKTLYTSAAAIPNG